MTRARFMIVGALWALSACKGASSDSSTKKDKEAVEADEGNGSIDVKYEKEKTTFTVGTAWAMPQPFDDGVLYTFFVYNDGAKDPPCSDELFPEKIGGNHWAVSIEMSPIGDPVPKKVKNKVYEKAMVRFYFVASKGEYKGSKFNGVTDISNENAKLTIVSIDGETITAKIDAEQEDQGSYMKGTFKAKICKPKKKDDDD